MQNQSHTKREAPPVAGTATAHQYDVLARLTKTTRPGSDTVAYAYDDYDRLTRVDYSLAATADIQYYYQAGSWKLTRITGPGTNLTYTYTTQDRSVQETFETTGQYFIRLANETTGQPAFMNCPGTGVGGREYFDYLYDSRGRLTAQRNWSGGGNFMQWLYEEASGRLTKQINYDFDTALKGLETAYAYDATGRLTRVGNQAYDTGGAAGDAVAVGYMFNAVGNVTKVILDDNASKWLAYQYDALDRLTREQRSGTAFDYLNEYWYDAAGNRTKLAYTQGGNTDTTTYLYDDNYRLTKSTLDAVDTTYLWDAAGNLTKKAETGADTWEYHWDARDKLTKVRKQPNGGAMADVASYSYDAQGRRFQKTAGGATTTYYQDGLTPVVEAKTGLTKVHRSTPGVLGNVSQTDDGSGNVFYAYDRLGNVLASFGTDGAFEAQPVMDAFGNVLSGDRADFGLTTKQYDENVEVYYFNARWYDSSLGQFIARDPFTSNGEKPYSLCDSNPVNRVDVLGLADWIDCAILITASIVATAAAVLACAGPQAGTPLCWIAVGAAVISWAAAAKCIYDTCKTGKGKKPPLPPPPSFTIRLVRDPDPTPLPPNLRPLSPGPTPLPPNLRPGPGVGYGPPYGPPPPPGYKPPMAPGPGLGNGPLLPGPTPLPPNLRPVVPGTDYFEWE